MQKKTKKIVIAAVAIAAVSGVALSANAAFKHWGGGMMMRHMDANGDGKVTKAEIMPRITKRFDRVDANSDGQVTKEEVGRNLDGLANRMQGDWLMGDEFTIADILAVHCLGWAFGLEIPVTNDKVKDYGKRARARAGFRQAGQK